MINANALSFKMFVIPTPGGILIPDRIRKWVAPLGHGTSLIHVVSTKWEAPSGHKYKERVLEKQSSNGELNLEHRTLAFAATKTLRQEGSQR